MSGFTEDDLAPKLNRSQLRLQALIQNRKKLDLTAQDLNVLLYLYAISTTRVVVPRGVLGIANDMQINDVQAYRATQKLRELDLIRKVDHKNKSYLIVDPLLINWGNNKKKAFKIQLWQQAVPSKRKRKIPDDIKNAIHDETL